MPFASRTSGGYNDLVVKAPSGREVPMYAPARVPLLLFVAMLLSPLALVSDVLRLRDGGTLRGRITHQADTVTVETPAWKVIIPRERILGIEAEPDPVEEYARRRSALPASPTAGDWTALGSWCASNGLDGQAREAWGEAIRLDPDAEAARRALGYVRREGRWVTEDELHAAIGDVKFRGRWMPREEMLAVLDAEKAAREARELADRSEREKREAAAAERRVREDAAGGDAAARRADAAARLREMEIRRQQEATAAQLGAPYDGTPLLYTGTWGYPYLGYGGPRYPTPYGTCRPYGYGYGYGGWTWGWNTDGGWLRVGGGCHGTGTHITIRR
jgi:hypothetical protein